MKNMASAFCLAACVLCAPLPCPAGNLYCDDYGNCTGTTDEGEPIRLYTDDYGNTTGSIGDESFRSYSDDFGNVTW